MPTAHDMPAAYKAEESAPHLTPAYAYIVQNEDGTTMFLTSRDRPITVANLPAEMNAANPQTFQPSQIKHSSIASKDRYEESATTITVSVETTSLQRYFLTAAAVKLKAWILRGVSQTLDSVALDFARDCIVVQSGILGRVGFQGNLIAVELTPEPFYVEGRIPRYYFGRSCQHMLYGEKYLGVGCGVDKSLWKYEANVIAVDPVQRTITIEGQRPDSAETFFNAGHLENLTAGGRMTIAWSAFDGSDTILKMVTWNPDVDVGDSIRAYAGCAHTLQACRRFANEANFGGFPDIPNRTPLAGVD